MIRAFAASLKYPVRFSIQFTFVVSFHIPFRAFTIGLASWLAMCECLHLFTWRDVFRRLPWLVGLVAASLLVFDTVAFVFREFIFFVLEH